MIQTTVYSKKNNKLTENFKHLIQGSVNCDPRAKFGLRRVNLRPTSTLFFEWNAARERKFCGPRACKCGPLSKNLFELKFF